MNPQSDGQKESQRSAVFEENILVKTFSFLSSFQLLPSPLIVFFFKIFCLRLLGGFVLASDIRSVIVEGSETFRSRRFFFFF